MNELDDFFDGMSGDDLKRVEKLVQIRNIRLNFALDHHLNTRGDRMDFRHYPHISEIYESTARVLVLQGSVQSFKGISVECPVHTPNGWVKNGDLQIGDIVSTPDGKGAKVLRIQDLGMRQLYEFTLDDGRTVESTHDHLWKVLRGTQRNCINEGRKSPQWDLSKEFEILTTEEIIYYMKYGNRFTIPASTFPIEKPVKELPLDPYFVGLMLGDGEIREKNIRFSSEDVQLLNVVDDSVECLGLELKQYGYTANHFFTSKIYCDRSGISKLKCKFEKIGLLGTCSHTKFIPDIYKEGSVEQRLAILQGILDTGGSAGDHGGVNIVLTSERLIKDIQEIVWSLGGAAIYTQRESYYMKDDERIEGKDCYSLNISMPNPDKCFRLSRKKRKLATKHRRTRSLGAKIVNARKTTKQEARCIILDNEEHLYIMDRYVVTHNSEFVIIDHLATAFTGLSVFFVLPKFETRNTYVQNRINKCVECVPEYKRIVSSGFFDSVSIKQFGKGTIKYVGSNVLADFVEFPADVLFVDEVDQCNKDNLTYAKDRLKASPYQFERYLGNPTEEGKGISKLFLESDRKEWCVPCLACGKYSKVDWFNTVVDPIVDKNEEVVDYSLRDKSWFEGCGRDINLVCPHKKCQGALERASQRGVWKAENPDSGISGFHISMMTNLINNVSGMWVSFREGIVDPLKMQQFYNSVLGLPYNAEGSKVTNKVLRNCSRGGYNFVINANSGHISDHEHVGPCSMGIDVGKVFDVRVSYIEPRGHRRAVFIGKVKTTTEIFDIMERYNVDKCVIDINPELHLVQEIQETAPTDVWLCTYRGEGKEHKQTFNYNDRIVHVDRTDALDRSYSQLLKRRNILPENYNSILGGKYVNEMCGPVRQMVKDANGKERYVWKQCEDHQRHCDTYDMIAAGMIINATIDEVIVGMFWWLTPLLGLFLI